MSNIVKLKPKKIPSYKAVNRSQSVGEIWLYGSIGSDFFGEGVTAKQFADDIKKLGNITQLHLRINSDGGVVTDARAMYNILVEHKAHVTVHIDGIAASAASFLAMAGDEIEISEGGFFMIHDARAVSIGTAEDMRHMADVLDQVNETIRQTYAARTGIEEDKIKKWMEEETWFTGKEAVNFGFADKLVENKRIAASISRADLFKNTPKILRPNRQRALETLKDC